MAREINPKVEARFCDPHKAAELLRTDTDTVRAMGKMGYLLNASFAAKMSETRRGPTQSFSLRYLGSLAAFRAESPGPTLAYDLAAYAVKTEVVEPCIDDFHLALGEVTDPNGQITQLNAAWVLGKSREWASHAQHLRAPQVGEPDSLLNAALLLDNTKWYHCAIPDF
jgi:hypothetical protein